jgi:hypothetical protein
MTPLLVRLGKAIGFVLIVGTALVLAAPAIVGIGYMTSSPTVGPSRSPGPITTPRSTIVPAPTPPASFDAAKLAAGYEAFTDLSHRAYAWFGIDPANTALYGKFVFYVEGAGTFTPSATAKVANRGRNDVEVTYDGKGSLDAGAKMDLELDRSLAQGSPAPTLLRLDGHIDPSSHTAQIDVWAGGKDGSDEHDADGEHRAGAAHYKLVATQPDSPAAAINAIVGATKAQDWNALYALCDTSYRALVSKDQWLAEEPAAISAWLAGDTLSDVVASDISAPNGDAGYWTATFTLTLVADGPAGHLTHASQVVLVYEATGWHIATGRQAP